MPSGSVILAVMVTGSPGTGDCGVCSTWRICGGITSMARNAPLASPGVGEGSEISGVESSASKVKSPRWVLVLRFRVWSASTLVPPFR